MRIETKKTPRSHYLGNKTAIEAGLSDHNVLINGQVLFLNMMMQGKWNEVKHRYNNGFARIESDDEYRSRIRSVVHLLAETIYLNPQVMVIGLAEAPIKPEDIACMIDEAMTIPLLKPFFRTMVQSSFTSMGIATFVNTDHFQVRALPLDVARQRHSLKDRVQQFELRSTQNDQKFMLYNLHLPYDLAKSPDPTALIQFAQNLFSNKEGVSVLAIGDFNIQPRQIIRHLKGVKSYTQIDNNLLAFANSSGQITRREYDTVDSIMHSSTLEMDERPFADADLTPAMGSHLFLEHRLFSRAVRSIEQSVEQVSANQSSRMT